MISLFTASTLKILTITEVMPMFFALNLQKINEFILAYFINPFGII